METYQKWCIQLSLQKEEVWSYWLGGLLVLSAAWLQLNSACSFLYDEFRVQMTTHISNMFIQTSLDHVFKSFFRLKTHFCI